jgi:branched-chain amino acid transport system ATP-binding protein
MFEIKNLNIAYGDVQIVHNVSFHVQREEIVSIIGSNGAGKTTTLKTVSGLLRPLSGEVNFDGIRLDKMDPADIVNMGVSQVPEGRKLFTALSVEVNLELGAVRKESKPNIKKNMEKVFTLFPILKNRRKQSAGSLSGGEQQMLAIARGLMSEPRMLILDEPSLGLAPLLVKTILSTIEMIRKGGATILLVEQNLVQALKISDRGYILETGRIVQEGTGVELMQNQMIRMNYLGI